MKSLGLCRYALTLGAASALLAGCGGSQAGGPMPMDTAISQAGAHKMSGSNGDLLYVSNGKNVVRVFTYPGGQPAGVTINQKGQTFNHLGPLQWDGHYMALEGNTPNAPYGKEFQLKISGSSATVVKTFRYKGPIHCGLYSWIQGGNIAIPYQGRGHAYLVGIWKYPGGGKPFETIKSFDGEKTSQTIESVTVSVAPSQ